MQHPTQVIPSINSLMHPKPQVIPSINSLMNPKPQVIPSINSLMHPKITPTEDPLITEGTKFCGVPVSHAEKIVKMSD